MSTFPLNFEADLNGILMALEPTYQLVQKEAKSRNKNAKAMPRTLSERYAVQTPIDGCYFGFEQIIEKLQADLKVLKNLIFGEERFYNFLFQNLDPNEVESKGDKEQICLHYMNSMLRWFFLDASNLLESFIRDFAESKGFKPHSNIDSTLKKVNKIISDPEHLNKIHEILLENEEEFVSLHRFMDQLETTKAGTEARDFLNMLLTIRNAAHNGFYYGKSLRAKTITVFGKHLDFTPERIIEVSIFDVPFFLKNAVGLLSAIASEDQSI